MKKYQFIYIYILFACLFACKQTDETNSVQKESHLISITTLSSSLDTRADITLGSDSIYAYPFGVGNEFNGIAIAPNSITDNSYTYYIPKAQSDFAFVNVEEKNSDYTVFASFDELTFSFKNSATSSNVDLVVGTLGAGDMGESPVVEESVPSYQIPLKRVVSKFTIGLKMVDVDGVEITELSQYVKSATVQMSSLSQKYSVFSGSYSEISSAKWMSDVVSVDNGSLLEICKDSYTFPSVAETVPELSLSLEFLNGHVQENSKLMSIIEANKHYKLTLVIKRISGLDFVFEDIIEEEIIIDEFS